MRLIELAEKYLSNDEEALLLKVDENGTIIESYIYNNYDIGFPKQFLRGLSLFSFSKSWSEQAKKDIKKCRKTGKPTENTYMLKGVNSGKRYVRIYTMEDDINIIHKKTSFQKEI